MRRGLREERPGMTEISADEEKQMYLKIMKNSCGTPRPPRCMGPYRVLLLEKYIRITSDYARVSRRFRCALFGVFFEFQHTLGDPVSLLRGAPPPAPLP